MNQPDGMSSPSLVDHPADIVKGNGIARKVKAYECPPMESTDSFKESDLRANSPNTNTLQRYTCKQTLVIPRTDSALICNPTHFSKSQLCRPHSSPLQRLLPKSNFQANSNSDDKTKHKSSFTLVFIELAEHCRRILLKNCGNDIIALERITNKEASQLNILYLHQLFIGFYLAKFKHKQTMVTTTLLQKSAVCLFLPPNITAKEYVLEFGTLVPAVYCIPGPVPIRVIDQSLLISCFGSNSSGNFVTEFGIDVYKYWKSTVAAVAILEKTFDKELWFYEKAIVDYVLCKFCCEDMHKVGLFDEKCLVLNVGGIDGYLLLIGYEQSRKVWRMFQ